MRKFLVISCLVLFSTAIYGQKTRLAQTTHNPNSADYTIKMHISGSHFKSAFGGTSVFVDAVPNGKKIELEGASVVYKRRVMLLTPGDYPAKLTNDGQKPNSPWFSQEYDLLLTDGTTWRGTVFGISK
jgi:hypothetical protein